jgi:hypothetical protein
MTGNVWNGAVPRCRAMTSSPFRTPLRQACPGNDRSVDPPWGGPQTPGSDWNIRFRTPPPATLSRLAHDVPTPTLKPPLRRSGVRVRVLITSYTRCLYLLLVFLYPQTSFSLYNMLSSQTSPITPANMSSDAPEVSCEVSRVRSRIFMS